MKTLKWVKDEESHAYMRERQNQNLVQCKSSKAEAWMENKLNETGLKWKRQAQWGFRLFDFWNSILGVAIEVDGQEHNKQIDKYRDQYNFQRSGIIVIRVRNFNDEDALFALNQIKGIQDTWQSRRESMGIVGKGGKQVRKKWQSASSVSELGFK